MDHEDNYEDSIEYRVLTYFNYIFVTAQNYLRAYSDAYGFDLQMESQDMAQLVVEKVLTSDAYGPSLGEQFFKRVTQNACNDFIDARRNDAIKGERWGQAMQWEFNPERSGWLDLTETIRGLGESQRAAIYESYCGYKAGELTGSARASWSGMERARRNLRKHYPEAA